jgi:hypothetical protein
VTAIFPAKNHFLSLQEDLLRSLSRQRSIENNNGDQKADGRLPSRDWMGIFMSQYCQDKQLMNVVGINRLGVLQRKKLSKQGLMNYTTIIPPLSLAGL